MSWETWELRGHCLEYDDDSHLYICDGVIVPSVTTLLKRRFPRKYANVPQFVLNRAAYLGSTLHGAIEHAEQTGDAASYQLLDYEKRIEDEFKSYLRLKERYEFKVDGNELPLVIPYKGEIVAAGRMDLLLTDREGRFGIGDIKRTAKLDEQYLAWQLVLYDFGVRYCYNIEPEFHTCVWLREKESAYRYIKVNPPLAERFLEEVWNENQSEIDIPYGGIGDEPDMLCCEGQG